MLSFLYPHPSETLPLSLVTVSPTHRVSLLCWHGSDLSEPVFHIFTLTGDFLLLRGLQVHGTISSPTASSSAIFPSFSPPPQLSAKPETRFCQKVVVTFVLTGHLEFVVFCEFKLCHSPGFVRYSKWEILKRNGSRENIVLQNRRINISKTKEFSVWQVLLGGWVKWRLKTSHWFRVTHRWSWSESHCWAMGTETNWNGFYRENSMREWI